MRKGLLSIRQLLPRAMEEEDFLEERRLIEGWRGLLLQMRVTPRDESHPSIRRHITANTCLAAWFCVVSIRMGLSNLFVSPGLHHLFGNTFANGGNCSNLMSCVACAAVAQCMLYRLIRSSWKGDNDVMAILESLVSSGPIDLRQRKVKMAAALYRVTVAFSRMMSGSLIGLFSGFLAVNLFFSDSWCVACFWVFWWTQDVIFAFSYGIDFCLFPATWFLVTSDYLLDVRHSIHLTAVLDPTDADLEELLSWMSIVWRKAVRVNRFSAALLNSVTLCTTPFTCFSLFVVLFTDNIILRLVIPVTSSTIACFSCLLLAVAADVTAASERLYDCLCDFACRSRLVSLRRL